MDFSSWNHDRYWNFIQFHLISVIALTCTRARVCVCVILFHREETTEYHEQRHRVRENNRYRHGECLYETNEGKRTITNEFIPTGKGRRRRENTFVVCIFSWIRLFFFRLSIKHGNHFLFSIFSIHLLHYLLFILRGRGKLNGEGKSS